MADFACAESLEEAAVKPTFSVRWLSAGLRWLEVTTWFLSSQERFCLRARGERTPTNKGLGVVSSACHAGRQRDTVRAHNPSFGN